MQCLLLIHAQPFHLLTVTLKYFIFGSCLWSPVITFWLEGFCTSIRILRLSPSSDVDIPIECQVKVISSRVFIVLSLLSQQILYMGVLHVLKQYYTENYSYLDSDPASQTFRFLFCLHWLPFSHSTVNNCIRESLFFSSQQK